MEKKLVMNFFPGNVQDRTIVSNYMVGHIQRLRLPKKISDQLFFCKICKFL